MPLRPYQRIGRSVSATASLPTSAPVVMYMGCSGFWGLFVWRSFSVGRASLVKRKGMGVRFLNDVSWPDGYDAGSSFDLKLASTSGGGSIACWPKTEDSKRRR